METNNSDQLYHSAVQSHGPEIARFAIGYERDLARRQELLQEIHLALWQSFPHFKHQCSLRTWVYRIAHNVGASHVQKSMRKVQGIELEDEAVLDYVDEQADIELIERRLDLNRLLNLIYHLAPLDRELMLLYLEGLDAANIGEVTGLSASNVATKIHRIKALLARKLKVETELGEQK